MKKNIFKILIIMLCFILIACSEKQIQKEDENVGNVENTSFIVKDSSELNEIENVFMTIKKGTLTKTSAVIIINDVSKKEYSYIEDFRIDKKDNGEWKELETTGENYGFNSRTYHIDNSNKLEMKLDWTHIYGSLETGEYRIVKYISDSKENYYFSVEFIIK